MSKRKYLKECIIRDMAVFLVHDLTIEYDKALAMIYQSVTFDKLMDDETGLYLCGSSYIYDIFTSELNLGKLVQMEV